MMLLARDKKIHYTCLLYLGMRGLLREPIQSSLNTLLLCRGLHQLVLGHNMRPLKSGHLCPPALQHSFLPVSPLVLILFLLPTFTGTEIKDLKALRTRSLNDVGDALEEMLPSEGSQCFSVELLLMQIGTQGQLREEDRGAFGDRQVLFSFWMNQEI